MFFAEQQKAGKDAILTLVQFDTNYEIIHQGAGINMVPSLTPRTFVPRGATALLDAISRTINETGVRLAAIPEKQRPGKVVFAIITDC